MLFYKQEFNVFESDDSKYELNEIHGSDKNDFGSVEQPINVVQVENVIGNLYQGERDTNPAEGIYI